MIHRDLEDRLHVAKRTLGEVKVQVQVRDLGLLQAAVARPRASAFGEDACGSLHHKVAALLHSVARNQALVDGNAVGTGGHHRVLRDERAPVDPHLRRGLRTRHRRHHG